MKVIYNTPIQVSEAKYHLLMHKFAGILAGRKDKQGNCFVKYLMMKYSNLLVKDL